MDFQSKIFNEFNRIIIDNAAICFYFAIMDKCQFCLVMYKPIILVNKCINWRIFHEMMFRKTQFIINSSYFYYMMPIKICSVTDSVCSSSSLLFSLMYSDSMIFKGFPKIIYVITLILLVVFVFVVRCSRYNVIWMKDLCIC